MPEVRVLTSFLGLSPKLERGIELAQSSRWNCCEHNFELSLDDTDLSLFF